MNIRNLFLLLIASLLVSACGVSVAETPISTPTELGFATATLPATFTPRPSATVFIPTLTPTLAPVEGTATTQVNVRASANANGEVLGQLDAGTVIQIVGKSSDGAWYYISYEASETGFGWVSATFIQTASSPNVPVIQATPRPSPTAGSSPTPAPGTVQGKTTQKVNVRSGPGTNFNTLGTLNAAETFIATGKSESGAWIQIIFADGPDGFGWITAAYVQAPGAETLPTLNDLGTPVAEIEDNGPTPTPEILPAAEDGDNATSPAITLELNPASERLLTFSDEVSAPSGDKADYVALKAPAGSKMALSISCEGNGSLRVEIRKNGVLIVTSQPLACGVNESVFTLTADTHILSVEARNSESMSNIRYTLTFRAAE